MKMSNEFDLNVCNMSEADKFKTVAFSLMKNNLRTVLTLAEAMDNALSKDNAEMYEVLKTVQSLIKCDLEIGKALAQHFGVFDSLADMLRSEFNEELNDECCDC